MPGSAGPAPKPHKKDAEAKVKTALQLSRQKLSKAANLIKEAEGWNAQLVAVGCPEHLRAATSQDMAAQLAKLEACRGALEMVVPTQAGFAPWAEHVRSTNLRMS